MTKHIVYTLDEADKPSHFLAVVEREEIQETMNKWFMAFRDGEKLKPREYNGISHSHIADFEVWSSPGEYE